MAGGHGALKTDPALERWNLMRENVYMHFKFTPSVTRKVLFWAGVVPVAAFYMAANQDYKWDWAGKTKNESLYRVPSPSSTTATEEES
ncbi:hypothetical protein FRC04_004091 [Tulasnella sp. 424]|nr:hypothetical protein FRC04_004091 [Tulasnella sp. 424]